MPYETKWQYAYRPVITSSGFGYGYAYGYDNVWTPYNPAPPLTAEQVKLLVDTCVDMYSYTVKQCTQVKEWMQYFWKNFIKPSFF